MATPGSADTLSTSSPKRDHLLATAWKLFYRDGYRAVGIDTLLEKAGVAKMTLYHHFASKEELIVAVLEQRSRNLLEAVDDAIAKAGRTPSRQLASVFDGLKAWFAADEFKGCAFIRALSEYPEPNHPIHQAAWKHKRAMNARIRTIVESAGARDPAALADTISLLIDGAIVAAHATSSTAPADSARSAAVALLKVESK
jgi:AcrR family transcriptional regulator